jgi:hypothetical protein
MAAAKPLTLSLPLRDSNCKIIDKAIGKISIVVEVLLMNIEISQADSITDSKIPEGPPPMNLMMLREILRCRFHLSIAIDNINAPMNKKIILLIYDDEVSAMSRIPNKGKRTSGIREVTARGIASDSHQTAIRKTTAAVCEAGILLASTGNMRRTAAPKIPHKSPDNCNFVKYPLLMLAPTKISKINVTAG